MIDTRMQADQPLTHFKASRQNPDNIDFRPKLYHGEYCIDAFYRDADDVVDCIIQETSEEDLFGAVKEFGK